VTGGEGGERFGNKCAWVDLGDEGYWSRGRHGEEMPINSIRGRHTCETYILFTLYSSISKWSFVRTGLPQSK